MKKHGLRWALGVIFLTMVAGLALDSPACAQEGQGKYIAEATKGLAKLVDAANRDGFVLQPNSFSIGGAWLTKNEEVWVPLYTVPLTAGKDFRFNAAGDGDTRDL